MSGIHRSPVNSPHKGQRRGALMFSLICVWTNGCVINRYAGDFRRHRTHYDIILMMVLKQEYATYDIYKCSQNNKSNRWWLYKCWVYMQQYICSTSDEISKVLFEAFYLCHYHTLMLCQYLEHTHLQIHSSILFRLLIEMVTLLVIISQDREYNHLHGGCLCVGRRRFKE